MSAIYNKTPQSGLERNAILLDTLTETEKQLIIKMAGDPIEDYYKTQQVDVKDYFSLQNPQRDPNRSAELRK